MWDFNISTDCVLAATDLDIAVVEKETRKCFPIDVAVPDNHDIKCKEIEK